MFFHFSIPICSCIALYLANEFSAFRLRISRKNSNRVRIFQLEGTEEPWQQSCGKGRQFEHKGAKSHLQCFQVSLLICEAAHETRLRVTRARREKFPWTGGEDGGSGAGEPRAWTRVAVNESYVYSATCSEILLLPYRKARWMENKLQGRVCVPIRLRLNGESQRNRERERERFR